MLSYGRFVTAVVNIVIIAFVMFLVIQGTNRLRRKEEVKAEAPQPPELSAEALLLTETAIGSRTAARYRMSPRLRPWLREKCLERSPPFPDGN